jgi:pimeloyl-ACP methyl ester carboxylesterase
VRREALRQTMTNWPEGPTTDRETARALLTLLDKFAEGATLETDYPLSVLLKEAEAITAAQGAGQTYFDRSRTGQHWLTVALPGGGKAVARVQVPEEAVKGTKMPLVLALHGAGGSENLFFDAYGVGAIKRYCAERGWMLVAPRSNGMGGGQTEQLVDELARVYPIDRKKVLVVGHSMGAMQAVGMASRSPERYAAVAALGGGGMVQATPALSAVPFYVGVGTDDFALAGARGLHEALKRADVRSVSYHEFEAVEHLAIVQAALPEVFAFFDKVLGRPSR